MNRPLKSIKLANYQSRDATYALEPLANVAARVSSQTMPDQVNIPGTRIPLLDQRLQKPRSLSGCHLSIGGRVLIHSLGPPFPVHRDHIEVAQLQLRKSTILENSL